MLTLEESRPLLNYLRFWSKLHVFPYRVNVSSGKFIQLPNWKMIAWRILHFLSVLHCLYGLLAVLNILMLRRNEVVVYHLPVQFDVTLVAFICHPAIVIAHISNQLIFTKIFNELYESGRNSSGRRHLKNMSIAELLVFGIAAVIIGVIVFYMIMICIQPNMSHLLINSSLLVSCRSNIGVRTLTYCIEMYFSALWLVNAGFLLSKTALVVAKVEADLDKSLVNLSKARSAGVIDRSLQGIRKVQLYLQLFNGYNCWYVLAYKTVMILGAIINGYMGVRYRNNLLVTVFCWFVHLACLITHVGVFQRAYRVVSGQWDIKREIEANSKRIGDRNKRRYFLLKVKSLRCVGLRVGQFHEIERNCAICFVDYVERQLLSCLLAF